MRTPCARSLRIEGAQTCPQIPNVSVGVMWCAMETLGPLSVMYRATQHEIREGNSLSAENERDDDWWSSSHAFHSRSNILHAYIFTLTLPLSTGFPPEVFRFEIVLLQTPLSVYKYVELWRMGWDAGVGAWLNWFLMCECLCGNHICIMMWVLLKRYDDDDLCEWSMMALRIDELL